MSETIRYALTFARCKTLMATARNNDNGKPIGNNTRLYEMWHRGDVSHYEVQLHGHVIMEVHKDGWVIDSCGWRSVTTKARLNRYLPDEFVVKQKNGRWWLLSNPDYNEDQWGKATEFTDGAFLHQNGKVFDSITTWWDDKYHGLDDIHLGCDEVVA